MSIYIESGHAGATRALGSALQARKTSLSFVAVILSFGCLAEAAENSAGALEEIVVTAQKRTQNLQDVPMAITALSEGKLDRLNIDNMAGYMKVVPGLDYIDRGPTGRRGNRPLSIRGVFAGAGEATVGFYINEVPVPAFDPAIFDINRIEVLRGPQGTLYGASSMGGTIKLVANEPDPGAFSARIDTTVSHTRDGGYNLSGSAVANVPLVDQVMALRVSAVSRSYDGYVDNVSSDSIGITSDVVDFNEFDVDENHNTEQVNAVRAALAYTPNDRLSVTPTLLYQRTDVGARDTFLTSLDGLQSSFKLDTGTTEENFLADITVNYAASGFDIVSNTSWYDTEFDDPDDVTDLERSFVPSTPPIAQQNIGDTQIFTQELRVLSAEDGTGSNRFDWTAGLFYTEKDEEQTSLETAPGFGQVTRDDVTFVADQFGVTPDEVSLAFFGVLFDEIDDLAFASNGSLKTEEVAAFGELTTHLSDNWDLLFGLRWFDTSFDLVQSADGLFNGGPSGPTSASSSDDGITPKVSLSYMTDADQLFYTTVAKGYRRGGANIPVGSICDSDLADLGLADTPAGFDSDSLWSYEVGTKWVFQRASTVLNAAAYYIDWSDIQQSVLLPGCFQSFTANVGKAHSQGFEVELSSAPLDGLNLGFSVSYIDAEFDESNDSLGIEKGDPVQIVPEWKVNADVEYVFPVGTKLDGFFRADYQYIGDATFGFDFDQPNLNDRPAYDIAGIQIGVREERWELLLSVQNLFNERPRLGVLDFGVALDSDDLFVNTLRPRTVGVTLRAWFD